MNPCFKCGGACCKYIWFPIPEDTEKNTLQWFKNHRGVLIKGNRILFNLQCKYLQNGKCSIYPNRPDFCKQFKIKGNSCKMTQNDLKELTKNNR